MSALNFIFGLLRKIYHILIPPLQWRPFIIIILGIIIGMIFHLLIISNAFSYISDDPEACINCHVMIPQFSTWERGSHGRVANCNDCHVPHNNFMNKYYFKAKDGLRHSTMFTFRMEPQVIQIKEAGREVVQSNCIRCHDNLVHPIASGSFGNKSIIKDGEGYCWRCHRETPHGKVNSLSSTPHSIIPKMKPNIQEFLKERLAK